MTRLWRRIDGHDRSWSRFDPLMAIMASISRQISLDFRLKKTHDRATIRSWSFVDCPHLEWRRFHPVCFPIAARSRHYRGSIEPRSWSSSTTSPRCPIDLQVTGGSRSLDRDPLSPSVRWRSNRADETRRHLSKNNKLIS